MLPQRVLLIVAKRRPEKSPLLLNVGEFLDQRVIDRSPPAHVFEGLCQQLVEVPVDQAILVQKAPVFVVSSPVVEAP